MHKRQREVLESMRQRVQILEKEMASDEVIEDHTKRMKLAKELNKLKAPVLLYEEFVKFEEEQRQTHLVRQDKNETEEMRELAAAEYQHLTADLANKEGQLTHLLLGKESGDDRDVYIEVRAGAGGAEAAIFVGDLIRMYIRYAERQHWKIETVNLSFNEQGGYRNAILACKGENVYGRLKFESGTHRCKECRRRKLRGDCILPLALLR